MNSDRATRIRIVIAILRKNPPSEANAEEQLQEVLALSQAAGCHKACELIRQAVAAFNQQTDTTEQHSWVKEYGLGSAILLALDNQHRASADQIAEYLRVPLPLVGSELTTLVQNGVVTWGFLGQYRVGAGYADYLKAHGA